MVQRNQEACHPLMIAAAVLAQTALAVPLARAAEPLAIAIEAAADHHVSAQGDFPGGLEKSWEYDFGSQRSSANITGIVAHGLLAAHKLTGLSEHEESALRAARSLLAAFDGNWKQRRPFTQDIEFLAAAGFIIDGARWFKVTRGRYSPERYVARIVEGRRAGKIPQIAAWDVASAIRAAAAVGELGYAKGLLSSILQRRGEWDLPGQSAGVQLSRGSLLWAMAELRDRAGLTPDLLALARDLTRELAAAQRNDGSWLDQTGGSICTQTTAYAILGLTRWREGATAAARGRAWLQRAALTDKWFFDGGHMWATTYKQSGAPDQSFNSEIQSEAMLALASGS